MSFNNPDYIVANNLVKDFDDNRNLEGFSSSATSGQDKARNHQLNTIIELLIKLHEKIDKISERINRQEPQKNNKIETDIDQLVKQVSKLKIEENVVIKNKKVFSNKFERYVEQIKPAKPDTSK